VHGSVLTVVGQNSLPISTAIRSLRQNSSSCSRRRAVASNVPSSKTRLIMAPPKRVADAARRFEPSARGRACFCVLNVCTPPRAQLHPAMWAFLGLAEGEISTGREFWGSTGRLLTLAPCKIFGVPSCVSVAKRVRPALTTGRRTAAATQNSKSKHFA
jgi:hypothetical protein